MWTHWMWTDILSGGCGQTQLLGLSSGRCLGEVRQPSLPQMCLIESRFRLADLKNLIDYISALIVGI